jgi:hypothetical protein
MDICAPAGNRNPAIHHVSSPFALNCPAFFQLTATPLEAYKRLQLNIALHRTDSIDLLKNVKPTLFPILWMQEVKQITGTRAVNRRRSELHCFKQFHERFDTN